MNPSLNDLVSCFGFRVPIILVSEIMSRCLSLSVRTRNIIGDTHFKIPNANPSPASPLQEVDVSTMDIRTVSKDCQHPTTFQMIFFFFKNITLFTI